MENPLVSIVVPVYNVDCYLDRCLQSIVSQTYSYIEILLINDGSTDGSPAICREWQNKDHRIQYFSKENGGLSDARNFGIEHSTGSLLMFVDSDDVIDPRCVDLLLAALIEGDADIALSANLERFTSEDNLTFDTTPLSPIRTYSQSEFAEEFFRLKGNRTLHYACSKLFKRKTLTSEHFPKGLLNEDVEGTFKSLILADRIAEIDNTVYWYYVNPDSITESSFGENYLNLGEVWRRVVALAKSEAPQYVLAAEYNYYRSDFTILCEMILKGDSESDERYDGLAQVHLNRLKGNLGILLKGRMALKRKLLLIAVAFFFTPLRVVYRNINSRHSQHA